MKQIVMAAALAVAAMLMPYRAEAFEFVADADGQLNVVEVSPHIETGEVWAIARTESYYETKNTVWDHCQYVLSTYGYGIVLPNAVNECEQEVALVNGTTTTQLDSLAEGQFVALPLPYQLASLYLQPATPPVDIVAELTAAVERSNAVVIAAINAQATPPDLTADFEALQEAVNDLGEGDRALLEQRDQEIRELRDQHVADSEEIAGLTARIFELERQLAEEQELRAQLIDAFRSTNEELRQEVRTLTEELRQEREENAAFREGYAELAADLKLQQENAVTRDGEVAALQAALDEAVRENTELTEALAIAEERAAAIVVEQPAEAVTDQNLNSPQTLGAESESESVSNNENAWDWILARWYWFLIAVLATLLLLTLLVAYKARQGKSRALENERSALEEHHKSKEQLSGLRKDLKQKDTAYGELQGQHGQLQRENAELTQTIDDLHEQLRVGYQEHTKDLRELATSQRQLAEMTAMTPDWVIGHRRVYTIGEDEHVIVLRRVETGSDGVTPERWYQTEFTRGDTLVNEKNLSSHLSNARKPKGGGNISAAA